MALNQEQQLLMGIGRLDAVRTLEKFKDMDAVLQERERGNSEATQRAKAFTDLRAAKIIHSSLPEQQQQITSPDDLVLSAAESGGRPLDHPVFDRKRSDDKKRMAGQLYKSAKTAILQEPLPAKGEDGFVILERDLKKLKQLHGDAHKDGRDFGEVWMEDVDKAKLSYVDRLRYQMQARQYELVLDGKLSAQEISKTLADEFGPEMDRVMNDDKYAELMSMSSDQLGRMFAKDNKERLDWMRSSMKIGMMSQEELHEAKQGLKFIAGLATDVAVGFIPFIGTGVGVYMAATGDDIFINAFTGDDYKLRWWERGLVALPAVGPLFRLARAPVAVATKTARQTANVTEDVIKILRKGLSTDIGDLVVKGGPNKLAKAVQGLKDTGKTEELSRLLLEIKRGDRVIEDTEITLVKVLQSVMDTNKGAARARIRVLDDSPIVQLAKHAIETGDPTARREIVDLILNSTGDASSARMRKLMETLDVDADGVDLILKDLRTMRPADKFVSKAELDIVNGRKAKRQAEQRLENLRKAREAKKAKAEEAAKAKAEQAALIEKQAKQAKSLEETATGDAPVPEVQQAPVDSTIKQPKGGDVKVVAQSENSVVVVDGEGRMAELIKGIDVEKRGFITARVEELGSYDAVKAVYSNDDKVSEFALAVAEERYGARTVEEGVTVVPEGARTTAPKPKRLRKLRAELDELENRLLMDETDAEAYEKLVKMEAQVEGDIKNFPDAKGVEFRQKFLEKVKKTKAMIDPDDLNTPVGDVEALITRAQNNASGQTDISLEAVSEMKARQGAGETVLIVDSRGSKVREAIGIRPEDNPVNPHDVVVRRHDDGTYTVLSKGDDARTLSVGARDAIKKFTKEKPKTVLRKGKGKK